MIRRESGQLSAMRQRDLNRNIDITWRLFGCRVASIQQLASGLRNSSANQILAVRIPSMIDSRSPFSVSGFHKPRLKLGLRGEEITWRKATVSRERRD